MNTLYHPRGVGWGLIRQPAWHLRELWRNPAYRALHRFERQLARVPRFNKTTVYYKNWPIQIADRDSFLSAWDEIFVNRIYEVPPATGSLPFLVDAGANIGLAALAWKLHYGDFEYLGFEPDPEVADICRKNLQAWGIKGDLKVAAVGAQAGEAEFLPDHADGGSLTGPTENRMAGTISVEMLKLSGFINREVDLLKIDIEGTEADVLQDIFPQLHLVRCLFVEWHSVAGKRGLGRAVDLLESAGFDCYQQVAVGPSHPFTSRPTEGKFSQQLNLFAVRP